MIEEKVLIPSTTGSNLHGIHFMESIESKNPYIIPGNIALISVYMPKTIIPWINIDWNPAKEPFDISHI